MVTITIHSETKEEFEDLMDKEILKQLKESGDPNKTLLKMSRKTNRRGISYDEFVRVLMKIYKKNR